MSKVDAIMGGGAGVVLRDVEESDLPVFFEHQREPDANRMAAFPAREREAFFAHWRENVLGSASARTKTIVVDGVLAGYVGSWEDGGRRLVAYWLGRAFWGRGVATSALRDFVTQETTRPLHAHVVAHNVGSIRVLERCGFRRVGEAAVGADGVEERLYYLDG